MTTYARPGYKLQQHSVLPVIVEVQGDYRLTYCHNNYNRNLAIVAHVDHGKTTLVDALMKQGKVFRARQQVGTLIMDSNPLERERGITILAKNASVSYGDVRINVIDTPGHADFSGEVERVMNMADGCLLLVDAVDGPMPQTTYVLRQALRQSVNPLVVINKIDRPEARVAEVVDMVQDLFLEVATTMEQLDYPVLYASARHGYATSSLEAPGSDMKPLFEAILDSVPPPTGDPDAPLQMLVAALDYDNNLGQVAVGRLTNGMMRMQDKVALLGRDDAFIGQIPNILGTFPASLGYMSLIILWNNRGDNRLKERLRSVGRMALTNYLMQTVLGVILLTTLLGDVDLANRGVILIFVFAVWALQVWWSKAWLSRFQFVPAEWIWQVATYRKVQPLRRPMQPRGAV